MKVIINADDLGLSLETNTAIDAAIRKERISSCSILANGMAFDDAVCITKRYPNISFGVHLNIIEFCPLTNALIFQEFGLVDNHGKFIEKAAFVVKDYTLELKDAIYEEWMSQINKIKNAGIAISHIDSHQHTHGIFALQDVLYRVMYDSGITKVRRQPHTSMLAIFLSLNNKYKVKLAKSGVNGKPKKKFLIRRLNQLQSSVRHYYWIKQMKKVAIITDGFQAYGNYIFLFSKYYRWFHFDSIELMCHPGHEAYAHETECVMSDVLRTYTNYRLISYNEL